MSFPSASGILVLAPVVKNARAGDAGLVPGSGKIPLEEKWKVLSILA